MNWKMTAFTLVGVIILGGLLNWQVSENQKLTNENERLSSQLSEQIDINEDYQKRINSLHELDTKHTQELTNAKAKIDKLSDDVRNGSKRMWVKADCPRFESGSTSGVDVSRSATLARDVEQDYFDLFKQLETLEKQYLGLRDYVKRECYR